MSSLSKTMFASSSLFFSVLVFAAGAEKPREKSIERYKQLWTNSVLTVAPVVVADGKAAPVEPKDDEIAKLTKRVEELEAAMKKLQERDGAKARPDAKKPKGADDNDIATNQPPEMEPLLAQSQLVKLANIEAQRRGLTVTRRVIQPTVEGPNAYRVRTEVRVTGKEQALYQWLDRLHAPPMFRAVTHLRVSPNRANDTEIECSAVFEQWLLPKGKAGKKATYGELRPLTEPEHYPMELLLKLVNAIPEKSIRLERVEFLNMTDGEQIIRSIRAQGRADELAQVNRFNLNLKEAPGFGDYAWTTPPPAETKDGRWAFIFDANFEPE